MCENEILLLISVLNFIPYKIYFFIDKRLDFEICPREMMLLYPTSLTGEISEVPWTVAPSFLDRIPCLLAALEENKS